MKKSCKELKRLSRGTLVGKWGNVILVFFIIQIIVSLATTPFQKSYSDLAMQAYADIYTEAGMASLIPAMPTTQSLIISTVAILVISLASTVLSAGQLNIHLSLLRGEAFDLKKLFCEFKNRADRYIIASLLMIGISLLCIIPVLAAAFAMGILSATGDIGVVTIAMIVVLVITYILTLVLIFYFSIKFSQVMFFLIDNPEMSVIQSFKESAKVMKGNYGRYLYMLLSFIPMGLLAGLTLGIGSLWVAPYTITVQAAFYMDVTGEFQRREEEQKRLDEEMGPVLSD